MLLLAPVRSPPAESGVHRPSWQRKSTTEANPLYSAPQLTPTCRKRPMSASIMRPGTAISLALMLIHSTPLPYQSPPAGSGP